MSDREKSKKKHRTYFAQEPRNNISKHNRLVRFVIIWRSWDSSEVPEIALPFVKTGVLAAGIEEQDVGCAFYEPSTVKTLDASGTHRLERPGEVGILWLLRFNLHRGGFVAERADEAIAVAILGDGDGDLRLDDGIDSTNFVGDLPGALEEEGIPDVALDFRLRHGCRARSCARMGSWKREGEGEGRVGEVAGCAWLG